MKIKRIIIILFFLAEIRCKDRYEPPVLSAPNSFLVVEGFINCGNGPTTIQLSRTAKLADTSHIAPELHAIVSVESENGNLNYTLSDLGKGFYSSDQLNLDRTQKYHIHIRTSDGKEYVSDFSSPVVTPPIDSISWKRNNDGITIFSTTHDPQNSTRYYKWEYDETWEVHSSFISSLEYVGGQIIPRPDPNATYACWHTEASTNIIIGNSLGLSNDVIALQPIASIPQSSEKISVKYSINVRQIALGKEAYQFLEQMKKNTEELGTIFDPQPSQTSGNIHCLSNPAELVIGFIYTSTAQEKRIFISNSDLPDWGYTIDCRMIFITPDSLEFYFGKNQYWPLVHASDPRRGDGYSASVRGCVDCTLRGTNIKPSFWP